MQNVSQRRTLSEQTCFHFAFGKLIVCKMRGVEYSGVEYSGIFKLSEKPTPAHNICGNNYIASNKVFQVLSAVSFKNSIERFISDISLKFSVSIITAPSNPAPFKLLKISLKSYTPNDGRQVLPFSSTSEI